jgi:hypothetical protein
VFSILPKNNLPSGLRYHKPDEYQPLTSTQFPIPKSPVLINTSLLHDTMTSLYKQSIPVFTKYLKNLSAIVKKGQAYADEKSIKHEDVLKYRLISDMQG